MKRLPIGYSSLENMLNKNCIYVDKTMFVEKLVRDGKCYFLSRPRRFGRSLLVDTLKEAFLGNKKIFEGLYLENNWDWSKVYPVVHISFVIGEIRNYEQLEAKITSTLNRIAASYDLEITETFISNKFEELILKLKQKYNQSVVILVDEYDKPLVDNITDTELCNSLRSGLSDFYSVIKEMENNLKFVFLTGVSRFNKARLFSGFDNLEDISLDSRYADICGYTQVEIEKGLSEYIEDGNVDLAKLKRWYGGYNFLGTEVQQVYNPFDVFLFCNKNYTYNSYWFSSGMSTLFVRLFKIQNYDPTTIESTLVSDSVLDFFDVDNIPMAALLFQTGYLTIAEVVKIDNITKYRFKVPNLEVQISLSAYLEQISSSTRIKRANE